MLYKDGDNLQMCLVMILICKCAYLTCMNCNERKILMQFLLSYDDDDEYTRVRPYDLSLVMMITKDIKDISKRNLA